MSLQGINEYADCTLCCE